MAKRSEKSVRRVKDTLTVPAAQRRKTERALAARDRGGVAMLPATQGGARVPMGIGPFDTPGVGAVIGLPDEAGNIGTPGNLNIWGYLTGEDYNPDLDGFPMFGKYDQMRRGDAQVSASLAQIKLPFKAARKVIKPATDDPEDVAIADFVQETLLGDRAMKRPFEQVLDHLMLRFDYGCSAEEIIWTIGENQELRFHDLAPRLPRTFYRWVEFPNGPQVGDLQYLQQFAPKNGQYGFWNIPSDRLMLHTHRREGNNYYGISILRPAYPSWFWKQQLYRIDAIRHDRLGAGIFIARLTVDYKAQVAPLSKIEETLQGLRSHERAYVVQPFGVEYDILVPKNGEATTTGILLSIEHHNQMIAANVLQQFSTQGQQKHGSLGQAKVTHDVFMDALVGQGVEMAAELEDGVIRKLCDANFDMTNRGYPRFQFADIASADVNSIADNLAKLATADLVTPEDGLENWIRELHDAPALPEELKGRNRVQPAPAPSVPVTPGGPAPDGGAPAPHPTAEHGEGGPTPVQAAAREPFMEQGRKFGRVPTDFERRVLDLHGVPSTLDDLHAGLVRKLSTIRRSQLKTVAGRIAQKDSRKTASFTDIRHQHVKMPQVTDLVQAIRGAQTKALDYGRSTVRDELKRQGAEVPKELAGTAAAGKRTTTSSLVSSAQITARKQADTWQARILDTGVRLRRTGLQGKDLEARIQKDLEDEIESGAKRDAGAEINEAFGLGRAGMASELGDQIESATYSAILDANTCFWPGTTIATRRGSVAVEDLKAEDDVLTGVGRWSPIYGVYRLVGKRSVSIAAGGRRLRVTVDHPVLVERQGRLAWLEAGDIVTGDALLAYAAEQPSIEASGMDATLRYSQNSEAEPPRGHGFPPISLPCATAGMPIGSVYVDHHVQFRKEEIPDFSLSNRVFGRVLHAKKRERLSDAYLDTAGAGPPPFNRCASGAPQPLATLWTRRVAVDAVEQLDAPEWVYDIALTLDHTLFADGFFVHNCEGCADLDGEEFDIDSDEYDANLPPNASCEGGDACRCVYIYQTKDTAE